MESEQNKSEQATPYKLQKAREKGQVSKSQEVNAVLSLVVFVAVAFALFGQIIAQFKKLSINIFNQVGAGIVEPVTIIYLLADAFITAFQLIIPILAALILVGIFTNAMQVGLTLSFFPMKPNFKKMNPATNLKKIFSKRTLFELVKVLLKIVAFSLVLIFMSDFLITQAQQLVQTPNSGLADTWSSTYFSITLILLFVLAAISLIDFLFNKQDFKKQMMMSRREVKEEHKNREGDPEIKAKRKQNQKELLEKSASLSSVKNADVVVTNPTHIAVALKFDRESMVSPQIISIGKGPLAEKIRLAARQNRVPVVRNVRLARLLYRKLKLNQFIPPDMFKEVAPVYKWLYRIKGAQQNG